ncbi:MAG: nucleoside 2-deoxyribosyltransferase domain-containing protein [Alphaproteobacteria bacterium]|nr:nucleoside 2-deoxyribosyltransferase domain-containing protein [Alphaproteobacteria bacterium]
MIHIKAPHDYSMHQHKASVFLAGSIEMGSAEDWQAKVVAGLGHLDVLILNPRRDQWDSSWEQKITNAPFREQVEWELSALDAADIILVYYCPDTKAPVTMLELGLYAHSNPEKLIVCCPEGFWRKGNVDIVCAKYGVEQAETLEGLIAATAERVSACISSSSLSRRSV